MQRWILPALILGLFALPQRAPAPLIFTPGEGWRYETAGGEGSWRRGKAKDQLEVAQAAFDKKDFGTALKAARHVVHQWPFSDYAPRAQYIAGRCYEEAGQDERAFKAYQTLLEQYPKIDNYDDVVKRQKLITDRFLAGKGFKLFNYVPFLPSMDKTIKMYEQIIKNGPYSEVAPLAQVNIGDAHEHKFFKDLPAAAKAYERAADRYGDTPVGRDALYRVGEVHQQQAKTAEYDQSIAGLAISTFTDFTTLHPEDVRVAEAQKVIEQLRAEQARGSFVIARYYERHRKFEGAKIYFNDVVQKDPGSKYAESALQRIEAINKRLQK